MTQTLSAASFFDLKAKDIKGQEKALNSYKSKVILVVNTASQCGYTPQYKDLKALAEKYRAQGFEVLGFPSNDFGGQEPGSDKEIKEFCELNYKVDFPLFAKVVVKGPNKHPVYKFLTENGPKEQQGEVSWNFEKFLIGKNGEWLGRYKSKVRPMDSELTQAIEKALKS